MILGYPTGYLGTASTPPINGKRCGVCLSGVCPVSVVILPDSLPLTFRPHHVPTTLGKTTPPGWTSPDHAKTQRDAARELDAGIRRTSRSDADARSTRIRRTTGL